MLGTVVRVFDDKHGFEMLEPVAEKWVVHMIKDESIRIEVGKYEAGYSLVIVTLKSEECNFWRWGEGTVGF